MTGYKTDAERDGKGSWGNDGEGHWVQKPAFTWRKPGFEQRGDHPVVNVSWNDAVAFCKWLSGREGANIAYQQRRNGSMRAAQAQQRITGTGTTRNAWRRSRTLPMGPLRRSIQSGDSRLRRVMGTSIRLPWQASVGTHLGFTTCTAMLLSGARIGMAKATTRQAPQTTRGAQITDTTVSFAAVAGISGRSRRGRLGGAEVFPRRPQTT